jgi:pyruvate dehydrogenase E2 component (dihydrolipoamide acetyltransferase)
LDGDQIKVFGSVNVGVATAVEEGLIVPVIHNADSKSIVEVAHEARDLAEKARENRLVPDEVMGGTFTVTNLGMYGVDAFTPIINPPQSAILGVGRIAEKPVAVDQQIAVRPMMTLSLTFDHRVLDGVVAAGFLKTLKETLEKPQGLSLETGGSRIEKGR